MQVFMHNTATVMTAVATAAVFIATTPQEKWLEETSQKDHFLYFYDEKNAKTEFLGNFYKIPITYNGLHFQCSEAAFQAAKFPHEPALQHQFTTLDGNSAFKLAKQYSNQKRTDWLQVNQSIMLEVVRAKFTQHPNLLRLLLATGNAYLVEHTPLGRDAFWGDNGDGSGQNELGKVLMKIRAEFGGTGVVSPPSQYKEFIKALSPKKYPKSPSPPRLNRG